MMRRSIVFTAARIVPVGIAALSLSLAACSTTSTTDTDQDSSDTSANTGSEFSQGDTPETEEPRAEQVDLGTAYFDYDKSEVRDDMREVLRKNAGVLRDASSVTIVEGHADERGSEEYNLALGERRAEAVRRYLSALGVPNNKMKVVSYGEAKPAVRGHDESAWRWNRRAEFHTEE